MPSNLSKNSKTFPKQKLPLVSIIIPTLNSANVLDDCLKSIKKQKYKNYKIVIIDNGSTDNTLNIAKKYNSIIFFNTIKSAESSKAFGLKKITSDFVVMIDSDNILPHKNWLTSMLKPFSDQSIMGAEPLSFTYRSHSGFIERYCALLGANDPYAFYSGSYDRYSTLSNQWTNLKLSVQNKQQYLKILLQPHHSFPTIGANGTVYRTKFIQKLLNHKDYFYDTDILKAIKSNIFFAKVKNSIIHTYCESSISKFIKKQDRRSIDLYIYNRNPQYQNHNLNIIYFSFISATIIIPTIHAIIGYIKKPDLAWFFHPLACFLTIIIYAINTIKFKLGILKPINRNQWSQ